MALVGAVGAADTVVDGKVFLGDLPALVGDRVVIHGWVERVRRRPLVAFATLRDRSAQVQVVVRPPDALGATPEGSAVRVTGRVRPCATPRFGTVEIEAERVDVLAPATAPLPSMAGADAEARADLRHLDLRTRAAALVIEVQETLVASLRDALGARRFIELHTPRITAGGSESGAAVFPVDHFGTPACLAQSPQLALQVAMAGGLDRVFEVGPVFRAEPCTTNRHASEFTSFDVELSWIESEHDLMDLAEDLLRHALTAVRDRHGAEIAERFGVPVEVPDGGIPRLALDGAVPHVPAGRLTHRAEQALCKEARRRSGHSLVFITGYPAADRPFYTHRGEESAGPTRSFDLLWGGMEVSSGCQREHREDRLRRQAADAGMGHETMARYLDRFWLPMFGHGCPPHGGFGLGIDRLVMAACGLGSIREASFLYRGPGRCTP
jgi:aspartyl/asparaginyl-tRNA synthetase